MQKGRELKPQQGAILQFVKNTQLYILPNQQPFLVQNAKTKGTPQSVYLTFIPDNGGPHHGSDVARTDDMRLCSTQAYRESLPVKGDELSRRDVERRIHHH